jgi:hypothetical protein
LLILTTTITKKEKEEMELIYYLPSNSLPIIGTLANGFVEFEVD